MSKIHVSKYRKKKKQNCQQIILIFLQIFIFEIFIRFQQKIYLVKEAVICQQITSHQSSSFFLRQMDRQRVTETDYRTKNLFIIIVYRKETKLRPDRQLEVTLGIVSYYGIVVVIWFFLGKRINYCKIFILFIFLRFAFTICLLLFCVSNF